MLNARILTNSATRSVVAAAGTASVLTRRWRALAHHRQRAASAASDMPGGSTHQLLDAGRLTLRTSRCFSAANQLFELPTAFLASEIEHRHGAPSGSHVRESGWTTVYVSCPKPSSNAFIGRLVGVVIDCGQPQFPNAPERKQTLGEPVAVRPRMFRGLTPPGSPVDDSGKSPSPGWFVCSPEMLVTGTVSPLTTALTPNPDLSRSSSHSWGEGECLKFTVASDENTVGPAAGPTHHLVFTRTVSSNSSKTVRCSHGRPPPQESLHATNCLPWTSAAHRYSGPG